MNYGETMRVLEGQNTECLYVNTLPNDTILIQYNEAGEVYDIVNKLKELDISYSRGKHWDFIPKYLFSEKGYTEFKDITYDIIPDYSPVVYMFTNRGEYGYSQLTVYMSDVECDTVLAYEHQYKGNILIHYFVSK